MQTRKFWTDAGERAVRTFAQALIAALTAGFVITDVAQWQDALLTAAVAALVSVLTSIVGSGIGDKSSPSLLPGNSDTPETPDMTEIKNSRVSDSEQGDY